MVNAEGEITWNWHDTNASGFSYPSGHHTDKIMDNIQGTTQYSITLNSGERAWWYTNDTAEGDISFPSGDWTFHFWAETNSSDSDRIYPRVIRLSANNTFKPATSTSAYKTIKEVNGIKEIQYSITNNDTVSFLAGDRLAVEVLFSADDGDTLTIYFNSTTYPSSLTSPSNSPTYPTPEIPTIVLLSAGLATLGGYVWIRRLRRSEV